MSRQSTTEIQPAAGLSTSLQIAQAGIWLGWFDGAALPNPGKIGIGIVLTSPTGIRHESSVRLPAEGCSNEAELHALVAALEFARTLGVQKLRLHGDSQVAITHVAGQQRTGIARLVTLIERGQGLLAGFDEIELIWVPRHRNAEADRLSRAALGLPESPPPAGTKRRRQRR